jgi:glycosyltransferase involved in cell wall biosynthesis
MNVLLLCAGHPQNWSGIEFSSISLASALMAKGHSVFMGCADGGIVKRVAQANGIPTADVRIANSGDVIGIAKMIGVVLKENIDVLIASVGRDYWPATIVAKALSKKLVIVRHQLNKPKRVTCKLLSRYADRVVAVSQAVRKALLSWDVPEEKIDVVSTGIDLEKYDVSQTDRDRIRCEFHIRASEIIVGTACRLKKEKGVFELLRAFHRLCGRYPDLKLMYVGDGLEREALKSESRALNLEDRVIFTGFREDMEKLYASMDLFILPSTCEEAFGRVLIEAMASGKPVIATETGGIPEIITDQVNGLLIPRKDELAISDAIEKCITNPEFSAAIAVQGRTTVRLHYSLDRTGEEFEQSLLKARRTHAQVFGT